MHHSCELSNVILFRKIILANNTAEQTHLWVDAFENKFNELIPAT